MKQICPVSITVFSLILGMVTQGAMAADGASHRGLATPDWIVIALYGLSTIGLGFYFSLRQRDTKEYFTGGGNMHPGLIGVSIFATLLSTISYLSMPGEAYAKGPMLLTYIIALPLIYYVVAYVLLPVYMKHRVTSAYELLEQQLGLSVRLLGTSMFLALRLVWMTLLVFLAAGAMCTMMDVGTEHIPKVVLVVGIVSVIYTSLGGLRAVVITDFMQTVLLLGGALLVVITITMKMEGFGWFPTEWNPGWDTQPIISFDPKTRVTLVGTILSVLCWYICTAGGDQTAIQRFMATADLRAARKAVLIQYLVGATVAVTLTLVGFALLGFANAGGLGASEDLSADHLFPFYIATHLPAGVSGLVAAAVFAAAMSSIDSGINSVTAVVMTDFLERFGLKPATRHGQIWFARGLALVIGLFVVACARYAGAIPGNITAVTNKTVNLLVAPIFTLFVFALFMRKVGTVGAWIGAVVGTMVAACISFSGPLVYYLHTHFGIDPAIFDVKIIEATNAATGLSYSTCEDPISFQYIGPVSLVAGIGAGALAGWIWPRHDQRKPEYTTTTSRPRK